MPLITKISPQKKKGIFNIFVDGKFSFSLPEIDVVAKGLKVGEEVSAESLDGLKRSSNFAKMLDRTLRFVSSRPHSKHEVEGYLERRFPEKDGWENSLKEEVLKKLSDFSLLDDEEFAKWLFEKRSGGRKAKGLRFIKNELYRKRVDKEIIDELMAEKKGSDWRSVAKSLAIKKLPLYRNQTFEVKRRRLTAFLIRQGFELNDVFPVVDEVLKGN